MRTVFMTGKGGVGKSTLSAALARQLAGQGHRTLAVSLDPAHNLGDVFGRTPAPDETCAFADRLWLREVDLDAISTRYVRENIALLEETYGYTRSLNLDRTFRFLRYSPGIEEYAALTALEEILREEGRFDRIVFDTPPTGLTLRILALPGVTLGWQGRLIRLRRTILDKRYTIHNLQADGEDREVRLPHREEDDPVMRTLQRSHARFTALQDRLKGADNTVVLVFNPDYLSLRESLRLVRGLTDLALPLRAAFLNKSDDAEPQDADKVEREILEACPGLRLERVPCRPARHLTGPVIEHDLTRVLA